MNDMEWKDQEFIELSPEESLFEDSGVSLEPAEKAAEAPAAAHSSKKVIAVREEEIDQQMDLSDLLAATSSPVKKEEPQTPQDSTLGYYNSNAEEYCQSTLGADMSKEYRLFLKYMPTGARILDLGCGSGRDTKYFRDNGFNVTAIDGSEEMCRKAESYTGITVRQMDFLSLNDREIYAGIWASASLLHIPKKDLNRMFAKLRKALTKDGVLFVSFKEGSYEGLRSGRYYTDLTEGELFNLVNTVGGMKIVEAKHFTELRNGEEVRWLCAIIKKW